MFSALRQNGVLYILDKSNTPRLYTGQIVSTSSTQPMFNNPLSSTVDIFVKVDGKDMEFKQIPSNLSIANSGNMVIAENRDAMCQEVENMLRSSRQIIESVPYHNDIISSCDEMLKVLNPQFAKEKAQEEKIGLLENKVSGMENTLSDIKTMLSKALDKQ